MSKRKTKWSNGDVFAVPLCDGRFAVGQVLDLMMVNQVRIALYDEVFSSIQAIDLSNACRPDNLISLITGSREQLDYGVWKILGNKPTGIPIKSYPNEGFRQAGWIGAIHYDAAVIEDFLDAFYGLKPWDDWFDPNLFDAFLADINKKPKKLILVKNAQAER